MARFFRSSVVVLLLGVFAFSGLARAEGRDNRIPMDRDAGTPYGAVGLLINDDPMAPGLGTGFLVSPCHVLTAAHVVNLRHAIDGNEVLRFFYGEGKAGDPSFGIGGFADSVAARPLAWGRSLAFNAGTTQSREDATRNNGWGDWALLHLDTCLDDKAEYLHLLPIATADFVKQGGEAEVQIAGFPADKPMDQLIVQPECRLYGQMQSSGWQNDCITMPGNSGGPLLAQEPLAGEDWPRVMGIAVSSRSKLRDERAMRPTLRDVGDPDYFDYIPTIVPVSAFIADIARYLPEDPVVLDYLAGYPAPDRGYDVDQPKTAIADLTEAIRRHPDDPILLLRRAAWYLEDKAYDPAIADYDAALKLTPDFAPALRQRALALAARGDRLAGDLKNAIADLDRLVERFPQRIDLRVERGNLLMEEYDYERAVADFDVVIADDPLDIIALLSRADALFALGDMTGARADYDSAIAADPDRSYPYIQRGIFLTNLGEFAEAEADFERAAILEPENPWVYNATAIAYSSRLELKAALEAQNKAIALEDESGGLYTMRGAILQMMGRMDDAIADMKRGIELSPAEPFNKTMLAVALAHAGRATEARQVLVDFRKSWPADEWPGPLVRHLLGEIGEAELIKRTHVGNPVLQRYQDFDFNFYLGARDLASGDKKKARRHFQKVVDSGFTQFIEYGLAEAFIAEIDGKKLTP